MARVLYLSYDGMTDPLGQSQILPYLFGLSKQGHAITLVSCEKPDRFAKSSNPIREQCQANGVTWVPITYHKSPPMLSTVWDLFVLFRTAIRLQHKHHFQIVHCRSYIPAFVGLYLQQKYAAKFIFDIRGFWADERVEGGIWNLSNPVYKSVYNFFKRRERLWFQQASHVVSLTHAGKADILARPWLEVADEKISVIPCCVDTKVFDGSQLQHADQTSWRQKLQLNDASFVLSYVGSIGTWYMLEEMLDFFCVLLQQKPDAVFLFITQEPPAWVLKTAAVRNIPADRIRIQPAERKQVPVLLSLSQASLFFIRPTFSKKASSPTKQGEIMSMGIPLICNTGVGDTDAVVRQYNCGLLVEGFTKEDYRKAIEQLPQLQKLSAQDIRNAAIDFYGLEKGVAAYQKIYKRLTAN